MFKPKVIIGFAGPIGSGKDTLSAELAKALHGGVFKFATPLYAMAEAIDPVMRVGMTHEEKEGFVLGRQELGTRRSFLQKLGTEFGRNQIHSDIWSILQAVAIENSLGPVFFSDVRFDNEAALIREVGGHIIHLKPNWAPLGSTNNHASEAGVKFVRGDSILGLSKGKVAPAVRSCLAIIQDVFYAHLVKGPISGPLSVS